MATQAQYDAGTKALLTMAYNMINAEGDLPDFIKDKAKKMADQYCVQAAKAAIDAAEAATGN